MEFEEKMGVAENIKWLRTERDLTQEEFGKIADVSAMSVSQWENDRAVPRMGAVQRISDYFGIKASNIEYCRCGAARMADRRCICTRRATRYTPAEARNV